MATTGGKRTGRPTGRPPKAPKVLPTHVALDVPTPPDHFSEEGIKLWVLLWMNGKSYLTQADVPILTTLVETWEEKEFLRRSLAIGSVPRVYRMPNGTLGSHPYVTQLKEKGIQLNALFAATGFTPTDRARLQIMDDIVADAITEMLTDRKKIQASRRSKKAGDDVTE